MLPAKTISCDIHSDALILRPELKAMQREVARAMEEGAFGMSTGLVYAPGMWADTDEVIAIDIPPYRRNLPMVSTEIAWELAGERRQRLRSRCLLCGAWHKRGSLCV